MMTHFNKHGSPAMVAAYYGYPTHERFIYNRPPAIESAWQYERVRLCHNLARFRVGLHTKELNMLVDPQFSGKACQSAARFAMPHNL